MLDAIMAFIFNNIFYFIALGFGIWFVSRYLKVGMGKKIQSVNIADIERMKFIERMKNNKPILFKWLYRGKDMIGKIQAMRTIPIKPNPTPNPNGSPDYVVQLLVKPMLVAKLGITRPFSKLMPFQIAKSTIRMDSSTKSLGLPKWVSFDYFMGIWYDSSLKEEIHKDIIVDHNLFRSTAQQLASTFFSKSQEQSTFDPEHAHQLAMKEKELQIELAKKRGKVTTI